MRGCSPTATTWPRTTPSISIASSRSTTRRSTPGSSSTVTTTDWPRLEREGFRLVQYGTAEHVLLMINCVELISSHVDDSAVNPLNIGRFGKRRQEIHVPAARRHQRRPLATLESPADRPIDHGNRGRTPVDRRRRHAVRPHGQGSASDRVPPPRSVAAALRKPPRACCRSDCCSSCRRGAASWSETRCGRAVPASHIPASSSRRTPRTGSNCSESERLSELAERAGLSIAFVPHPNSIEFLTRPLPVHVRLPVPRRRHPGALCPWCGDDHRLLVERLRARLPQPAGDLLPVRPGGLLLRPARLPSRRLELRDRRLRSRRRRTSPKFSTSWRCSSIAS